MRDEIILALAGSLVLAALSMLALFSPKVQSYKYINQCLVAMIVYIIIATFVMVYAWYTVKA
ncbi:MAG TPA: hypothetical protein VHV10_04985 [Ktedonobacteraceae bacterium]|jgi:hypothetical protein|nr:hypothetical protein [Ktedonobacteraceae bacterium]